MVQYNQSGYLYNEGRYNAETITATADATLGALSATSSATVTHEATADAPLGALTATATATVIDVDVAASAQLGTITATATATVNPKLTGGTIGRPAGPRIDVKQEFIPIKDAPVEPARPQLVNAYALAYLTSATATATATITYVAELDDEEVLLALYGGTRLAKREHRTTPLRRKPRNPSRR